MARDTNFYYSFLALPRDKREAIVAVWDFCRAVDDVADESSAPREEQRASLEAWRAELTRVFEGGEPSTPEGRGLQQQLSKYPLPRPAFDDLITGVQMDVEGRSYETFADLEQYCYHVASTVGLMCLEIFGYRDPGAREYAVTLGKALQLTNILRDVGVDARNGRVYLPGEELRAAGCTLDELKRSEPTPALVGVLRTVARRAEGFYRLAAQQRPVVDRRRLVAAEIMAAIYRQLLADIERGGFAVLREPWRLSKWRKARIAAATWIATMVPPGLTAAVAG